jgi:hypothetical protein
MGDEDNVNGTFVSPLPFALYDDDIELLLLLARLDSTNAAQPLAAGCSTFAAGFRSHPFCSN